MQEAVIAVAQDERVLWANQRMERLLPSGIRLGAPLVQSVRDPEILGSVQNALEHRDVTVARAAKIFSGRIFDVTAAPMPGGGAVAVLHDQTEIERVEKTRRDFIANVSHELRTPLTSIQGYAETLLDSRNLPDTRARIRRDHSQERNPHGAADRGPAGAGAGGIGRAELQFPTRPRRRSCWTTRCKLSRNVAASRGIELSVMNTATVAGLGGSRRDSPGVLQPHR